MNARERFLACMHFEPVDRLPNWEMGYWAGTLERWHTEGLPRHPDAPLGLQPGAGVKGEGFPWRRGEPKDRSVRAHLAFDKGIEKIDGEWGIWPPFEREILWESAELIKQREPDGTVAMVRRDSSSLPHVLSWPVANREDWEHLRAERLSPDSPGRLPADWQQQVRTYRTRDWPLILGGPFLGVFSSLRTLFGFENLMYTFFDDPQLVHDVLSHLTLLWLTLFEQVLGDTDVDAAYFWEDMSYKSGSMVSPRIFRTFLQPVYRRITGFFRDHGIDIILVDTDGSVWDLIPLFLDSGITGLYPFEVQAGMDVTAVREAYPQLQMMGGLDKMALVKGPEAIDAELRRIAPILPQGGYVPGVDHYVHPEVPWEHFLYYRNGLRKML